MTPVSTQEIVWMAVSVVAIAFGLWVAAIGYRDGFADGARWMARGDRHLSRPGPKWHRWHELRGVRHGLKEGWYDAARSYSRGMAPGEVETTGMRECAKQEREHLE